MPLCGRECRPFSPKVLKVFHGCAGMKDAHPWLSEKAGLGIEVGERAAAKSRSPKAEVPVRV